MEGKKTPTFKSFRVKYFIFLNKNKWNWQSWFRNGWVWNLFCSDSKRKFTFKSGRIKDENHFVSHYDIKYQRIELNSEIPESKDPCQPYCKRSICEKRRENCPIMTFRTFESLVCVVVPRTGVGTGWQSHSPPALSTPVRNSSRNRNV